ncbi:hypothetical protein Y1Q_0014263 [Alligator mississippiensis]|nr:hypothetical protein Y1Q_0014263 [Alligator mississippiensis]
MNETGKKAKPHDHGVEAFETGQNGLLLMTSTSIHDCDTMLHGKKRSSRRDTGHFRIAYWSRNSHGLPSSPFSKIKQRRDFHLGFSYLK